MTNDKLTSQKKIIFVLGMHRSGTSLITKAIQAVGANLGNNLMPAEQSNPKGYWEDLDVFHFNERLLDFINIRWDIPSTLVTVDFNDTKFDEWRREAIQLLRIKVENYDLLAIKDPRISLLIPFWEAAAKSIKVDIDYVISIRNPLDVSRSLIKRDKFNETKGLILWLNYNYKILQGLCNNNRSVIFVDYQKILNEPLNQLNRISYFITGSKTTTLTSTSKIKDFIDTYISKELSHSFSTIDHLDHLDQSLSGITDLYRCLDEFTQGQWSTVRASKTLKKINNYQLEAQNYQLQLGYYKDELIHRLDLQHQALKLQHQSLVERNNFQALVKDIINNKERETKKLIKDLVAQNEHNFQKLSQHLIDEKNQKKHLIQENNQQLENLRKKQLNEIDHYNNTITNLEKQHTQELKTWKNTVNEIHSSYSWKITAPLRMTLNFIQNSKKMLNRDRKIPVIKAILGLEKDHSGQWTTVDDEPQFDLNPSIFKISRGWHKVQFQAETLDNNSTLYPELLIDYGSGYEDNEKIALDHNKNRYQATIYFHQSPTAIQIRPCRQAGLVFKLNGIQVKKVPLPVFIISAAINIYKRDSKNGRNAFDIIQEKLKLIHDFGLFYTINNLNTLISNNEDGLDWGVEYTKWISEVETRYHISMKNKIKKIHNTKHNNHCIIIITDSLSNTNIDVSIHAIKNQLLHPHEILILHKNKNLYCYPTASDTSEKVLFNQWKNTTQSNIITLLKSGDQLSEYYLLALEESLLESTEYDMIYSDNDERSADGQRCNPHFKPDWSPDFLIESNYIGDTFSIPLHHLKIFLYRYKHPIELLPIYILYNLSTNYNKVKHINQILIHQKYANEKSIKNDNIITLIKPIIEKSRNATINVKNNTNQYRVNHHLPVSLPSVSIIIPTKDKVKLLKVCIESLIKTTNYENYEIIIIDNQSTKTETHSYLNKISNTSDIRVIQYNKAFNYSAINNYAVSQTQSEIVCFLNNDIEIINSEWLTELVSHAIRPEVGCVGAKLYYPDGRIQHGGVIIGIGGVAAHAFYFNEGDSAGYFNRLNSVQNYSAVTAACLAIRRELFCSIGKFNHKQLPVAFNDIDLCLRLREQGYSVIWTPYAELVHHESATRSDDKKRSDEIKAEVQYMQIRWRKWIINDPAYNHHLSLAIGNDFEYSLRQKNHSNSDTQTSVDLNPAQYPYLIESNEDRVSTIVTEAVDHQPEQTITQPGLSIIILTLEKPELIEPLLQSLLIAKKDFDHKGINIEIIVGDTGSTSSEVNNIYQSFNSEITLVRDLTYHFSHCNNQLFYEHVHYDSVLFLNNDIIFKDTGNALYGMYVTLTNNQETGIVGAYLTYPDGRLQHGGVSIIEDGDSKGLCYHPGHGSDFKKPAIDSVISMPAVTGACLLIRSDLFLNCGMFDIYYETEAQDIDLCFQARRLGYKIMLCYPGEIQHLENATRPKGEENYQDRARFVRKWAVFYSEILL